MFYENRNVNAILPISKENFLDGSYFESIEKYFCDVIAGRDEMIKFHTVLDMDVLQKPAVKGVVFSNDILLADMGYNNKDLNEIQLSSEKMALSLKKLDAEIKNNGGKFYYIGLPEQYSYFRNEYPEYIFNNSAVLEKTEESFFSELQKNNISFIDMNEEYKLKGKSKDFYSLVDHHFTYYGAFEAYDSIMNRINSDLELSLEILPKDDINFQTIPNEYIGSRSRKLLGAYHSDEKAVIGYPKINIPFVRKDNGKIVESNMFSVPGNNYDRITYLIYMGGDIAETVITTDRNELPNLLIFGDSFTNPIETLIYTGFNETRSIDLRKYDQKSIIQYVNEYKPDVVLCIRDDTSYLDFEGNGNIK